jgi:hypothetical protein
MRPITAMLLLALLGPADACLNDSTLPSEEAAFRERYAQTSPVFIWGRRALALGGLAVAGLLGTGCWLVYDERRTQAARAARRRHARPIQAR